MGDRSRVINKKNLASFCGCWPQLGCHLHCLRNFQLHSQFSVYDEEDDNISFRAAKYDAHGALTMAWVMCTTHTIAIDTHEPQEQSVRGVHSHKT